MKKTIIFKNVTLDDIPAKRRKNNAVMDFLEAFLDCGQIAVEIDAIASGYKYTHSARNALNVAARRLHAQKSVVITERGGKLYLINALLNEKK